MTRLTGRKATLVLAITGAAAMLATSAAQRPEPGPVGRSMLSDRPSKEQRREWMRGLKKGRRHA